MKSNLPLFKPLCFPKCASTTATIIVKTQQKAKCVVVDDIFANCARRLNYNARLLLFHRIMLSIVFLAVQVTCGLNPRKLHLEKLTEAFDAEYYDYYGTSVDSFTDVDIEQNNGKLLVTPKLSNTRYCWSCSTGDISNCRERGYLQKVQLNLLEH